MGYTTDFSGSFDLNKPLDDETYSFLCKFNETRRMARNVDPKYGIEGEIEWIEYIIKSILAPKGYILNGEVNWSGENTEDTGTIKVVSNKVITINHEEYYIINKKTKQQTAQRARRKKWNRAHNTK